VTYKGATPTKAADVQYTYTFNSWDKSVAKVTGDATYTATFSNKTNQYTIKFVNEDGTVLQSSAWDYGATPTFTAKEPLKDPDTANAYIFDGWTEAIGTVTGDKTYTATFKPYAYALKYTYDSTTTSYTVSGYSGYFHDVVIPETYNDGTNGEHAVTTLKDQVFRNSTTLTRVKILARLTNFGSNSFGLDTALNEVSLPEGLPLLNGYEVFCGASLLSALTIPSTVTSISANFFQKSYLASLDIPQAVTSIANNAFDSSAKLETVTFSGVPQIASLGDHAFLNCKAFKSVVIPSTISAFGTGAFEGCSLLDSVTLKEGFTSLNGSVVFQNCVALKSVIIPSSVTTISDSFFAEGGLTSVSIPSTVITISGSCFKSNKYLTSVTIEDGSILETIGDNAFANCPALTSFVFAGTAAKLTNIGKNTFLNDTALDKFTMAGPNNVSNDSPLDNAGKLSDVTLPSDWTKIPNNFFAGSTIESYVVPRQITEIGDSAFKGCSSLTSLTFESGSQLTQIDANAFRDDVALTSVKIPATVTALGSYAFGYCKALSSLDLTGCGKIGSTAFNEDGPFDGCTSLTSVTIPSSMTEIGYRLFKNSALTSIVLPNTVKVINSNAFENCDSLTSVTFASGTQQLTKIGSSAFLSCKALTSIILPATLTNIDSNAFDSCTALTDFQFAGTRAQWAAITKGNDWHVNAGFTTVTCTDGVVTL